MPLVLFAQSLIGILFVLRTLSVFRARGVIRESVVTNSGTIFVVLLCLVPLSVSRIPHAAAASALIVIFTFVFCFTLERKLITGTRERVPLFLDAWILEMNLGHSLSAARDAALRAECERFQALMRPVFEAREGERKTHPLLAASVLRELEQIGSSRHGQLARLEVLRARLRQGAEFRRKSGQAVRQTAIQSVTMLVLLLAMAIYTVNRYGWKETGDLVTSSVLLSTLGVGVMVRLARKSRWKL